ncbi:MAG TPA: hypothetical protein VMU42_07565 [Candidatus Sulfotelmatobacter sp.]|nr:hypothetical protein [Candidatus Sulfotelmatobacter sp.]
MRVVVDTNVFVSAALKDASLPALSVRLVEQRGIFLKSRDRTAAFRGSGTAAAGSVDRSCRASLAEAVAGYGSVDCTD